MPLKKTIFLELPLHVSYTLDDIFCPEFDIIYLLHQTFIPLSFNEQKPAWFQNNCKIRCLDIKYVFPIIYN